MASSRFVLLAIVVSCKWRHSVTHADDSDFCSTGHRRTKSITSPLFHFFFCFGRINPQPNRGFVTADSAQRSILSRRISTCR